MENTPKFKGVEHTVAYSDVSTNPEDFEGKTVLILGKFQDFNFSCLFFFFIFIRGCFIFRSRVEF